ncbi:MAG: alpha/beta fold hydrolase [Chloroflexota bacterium]
MRKLSIFLFTLLSLFLTACARAPQATAAPAVAPLLPSGDVPVARIEAAKTFVSQLADGEYEAATSVFDEKMSKALNTQKIAETWLVLIKQFGAFQQQTGTRTEQIDVYDVVYVTVDFASGPLDIKVVFNRQGQISGLFFLPAAVHAYEAPPYVNANAFTEREIVIGEGKLALPAVLTMPKGDGPFPVAVLVHGSGPNDRDESVGPNKPFRDIAWGLASNGIAVLRYDKRTYAHPEQFDETYLQTLTVWEETVDDAVAAVALLRQTDGVDPERVYVLGHSLGGMLLPRIGAAAPDVAGLIYLAAAARPLEDMLLEQVAYLANLDGQLTPEERQNLEAIQEQVARAKDPALSADVPGAALPLGIPAAYWLDLRTYDPAQAAVTLAQPMLFLQGARDYQVTQADFDLWYTALSERSDVVFRRYPTLNHLFLSGEGEPNPEEYNKPGHVAEDVLRDIAAWIQTPASLH